MNLFVNLVEFLEKKIEMVLSSFRTVLSVRI